MTRWLFMLLTWAGCVDLVYFGQRQAAQLGLNQPWVQPACFALSFLVFAVTRVTPQVVPAQDAFEQLKQAGRKPRRTAKR